MERVVREQDVLSNICHLTTPSYIVISNSYHLCQLRICVVDKLLFDSQLYKSYLKI